VTPLAAIGKLASGYAWQRLNAAVRDPAPHYRRTWRRTRQRLGIARHWRERGIRPELEDYPVSLYEDYSPAIQETLNRGGVSPFNGARILAWVTSAGTTGPRKLFPLTFPSMVQSGAAAIAYEYQLFRRFPHHLSRPILWLVAGASTERSPGGHRIGYLTNLTYGSTSRLLQRFYALPIGLARIPKGVETWTAVYAVATELGAIMSVTSRSVLAFIARIKSNVHTILKRWKEERHVIPEGIPPPPLSQRRWEHVRRVLSKDRWTLKELWPRLEGISTWTGGPCGPDAEQVREIAGAGVEVFDALYASTEGLIGVPVGGSPGAGVVHPKGIILEFLRHGTEIDASKLLKPWELREGVDYEIFMTTANGFVRYRIKDVVRCIGQMGRMPVISFRYKSDNVLRLAIASISEKDLLDACARAGFHCTDRTLFSPTKNYDGMILWCGDPVAPEVAGRISEALQQVSYTYNECIKYSLLKPIKVVPLTPDDPLFLRTLDHSQSKHRHLPLRPPDSEG